MRSSLPWRSPWRLSWKIVNRMSGRARLAREELRERAVERIHQAGLHLGRLLHEPLLEVERGLRPLEVIDREARLDDVVEIIGVVLRGERAQRDHAVLLLARVARLRRRAGDAGVDRRAHGVDVAPGAELLGL